MPALEHEAHEKFCHFVARGNEPLTAYVGAGYKRDKGAAEALVKKPRIAARIAELVPYYHKIYQSQETRRRLTKRRREEA